MAKRSFSFQILLLVPWTILLVAGAAGAKSDPTPVTDDLYLDQPLVLDNLTVWPVYTNRKLPALADFITLQEAQDHKQAVVREHSSGIAPPSPNAPNPPSRQAGAQAASPINQQEQQAAPVRQAVGQAFGGGATVHEVEIENSGDRPILVLAGTLIKGGNQDRLIGQDFIIPPKTTVPVDAFCVEHGRWTANRDGQATGGKFQAKSQLATFKARTAAQHGHNQGEVWDQVAKTNAQASKAPSTGTLMATVDDSNADAMKSRARIAEAVGKHFVDLGRAEKQPVGLAYAVDGKVIEMRVFVHPKVFARVQETLFATIALDAYLGEHTAKAEHRAIASKPAQAQDVVDLVKSAEAAKKEEITTKAGNKNVYRHTDKVQSASCYSNDDSQVPVTVQYNSQ